MNKKFDQIRYIGKDVATENIVPGSRVYGEKIEKKAGVEFRLWDPYRSKMAAALRQGVKTFPFKEDSKVLYLGAGNGTTVSHIADVCKHGFVYSVEFSPRAVTDLMMVADERKNIIPILANAKFPERYAEKVPQVDILYEDVAQKGQVDILKVNADKFLKQDGYLFLMVKARSIDVTKEPKYVFEVVANELMENYKILERIKLDPYEKDHMCIVMQKK
ncbi:MAG: fibrillarin-like rRNA/tRNA 2'-O-methyltransferase [archaeon]